MTVEVREAFPEEYEEAGEVVALAYQEFVDPGEEGWAEYLARIRDVAGRSDRTTILVAVESGRVLGCVTLELVGRVEDHVDEPLAEDESHVRMLGVLPEARRRGIARMLMEDCTARARKAGKTRMTLHTTQRMRAAQAMYDRLGFTRGEDYVFPDGFTLLCYRRAL